MGRVGMNTSPLSDPWETLGEQEETALENLLEDDSPDPWEIARETEIETEFFDPDLLAVFRQLRFESPESSEPSEYLESPEVCSEADEFLENSIDSIDRRAEGETAPTFSSTFSPVNENNTKENSPTVGNDRAEKSQHFQEIDQVNLIAHRPPYVSPFLSLKKTALSPPESPKNTIFSFVSHSEKSSPPPPKIQGIRQGDVLIMPLTEAIAHWVDHDITLPFWRDSAFQKCPDLILTTGQSTGHQHRISQGKADLYQRLGIHYLRVLSAQAVLTHPEHQAVSIPQGIWVVRRQREYNSFLYREQFVSD